MLDEVIDRLEPLREKGNYQAIYGTYITLENDIENYENQKKCLQYLTQAAMVDPDAMIRIAEVYEQGFYDVKPNKKRADFYYKEGIRILSLLASQGLPSSARALGHIYLEGLGTKQDIPRAERYYKFAEKAGYIDREYLCWTHYGFTLRQVAIPENFKDPIKREAASLLHGDRYSNLNPRTCMYLVREKAYVPIMKQGNSGWAGYSICNMRSQDFFSKFLINSDNNQYLQNVLFYIIYEKKGEEEDLQDGKLGWGGKEFKLRSVK